MKKVFVAALAALLLVMPVAAEAQQKKKKNQQNNQNPLTFIIGIFSTANCIIFCGGANSTVVTRVFIPRQERFVTRASTSTRYGAYATGALICTFTWPFINHFSGGNEPTSEEALMNTLSCWVPGLGIVLYLQNQNTP